jgi:hypothetical protein
VDETGHLGRAGIARSCWTSEKVLAKFLETSTGERSVKVDTIEERVDFNGRLDSVRKGTFGTFASSTEATKRTRVGGEI